MKYIYSEAQNNYSNYLFSYQVLLLAEEHDSIDQIYEMGFLPFRSIKGLYYLARSLRVNLSKFELTSENKRVLKKLDNIQLAIEPIGVSVNTDNKILQKDYLSDNGLKRILLPTGNFSEIFVFGNEGLVVTRITNNLIHYAHQFFKDKSFGMAGMTSVVNYAKETNKKFVYLGTCYGKNAMYKTQFRGFEFFDGINWSGDLDKLKHLSASDGNLKSKHLFQDQDYMEKFYNTRKLGRLIKNLQK